jgi:hypothetical protein
MRVWPDGAYGNRHDDHDKPRVMNRWELQPGQSLFGCGQLTMMEACWSLVNMRQDRRAATAREIRV